MVRTWGARFTDGVSPQPLPGLDVRAVSVWKAQGHLELQANMWLGFGEGKAV